MPSAKIWSLEASALSTCIPNLVRIVAEPGVTKSSKYEELPEPDILKAPCKWKPAPVTDGRLVLPRLKPSREFVVSTVKRFPPVADLMLKAAVESDAFWNKTAPPSAIEATVVALSLKTAIVPVLVLFVTTNVSADPLVRFETVVGACKVTVPPAVEPTATFVVEPAIALVPILIVWVLPLPAAVPIAIVLLTLELPRTMPPVLLAVPMA